MTSVFSLDDGLLLLLCLIPLFCELISGIIIGFSQVRKTNSLKESITHLFPDFDNRIFCCSNGYELEYFLENFLE